MTIGTRPWVCAALLVAACGDDTNASGGATAPTGAGDSNSSSGGTTDTGDSSGAPTTGGGDSASDTASTGSSGTAAPTTGTSASTTAVTTATTGTTATTDATTDTTTTTTAGTTAGGCGLCDEPNQQCIDDVCVTSCQGQDPSPCPEDQVCDVISGTCKPVDAACTLAGPEEPCGDRACGPGTVCDGVDTCLPIAPCGSVACTSEGHCWGTLCGCERIIECQEPSAELLNGPFSTDIGGIDFADDCNAWMVTLRSGPDYLRRLTPAGELTTWTGVANLNMGEVKVLRKLTIPQLKQVPPFTDKPAPPPPVPVEGLGEVAITYTCCPTCGCQANPPQGVARLVEDDPNNPLPIVIVALPTQGDGPFGHVPADAGPQGLAWGEDRVLYVGNSTMDGEYNTADLDNATQGVVYAFDARVTASAPVSPVHLLVALDGGDIYRFNALTKQAEFVVDLMSDVTSLAHDAFTGHVYAGLASLEVVKISPFTGDVEPFATMPGKGRVAVSPSGKLWYTPVKSLADLPLSSWDLPMAF